MKKQSIVVLQVRKEKVVKLQQSLLLHLKGGGITNKVKDPLPPRTVTCPQQP